jgi:hypothetical protein
MVTALGSFSLDRFQRRRGANPPCQSEQQTCADFLKLALASSPTFHKLVYLAGMKDQTTGHYRDTTLALMFNGEEIDRAAREQHEQTFSGWLCLNLLQQMADLTSYLAHIQSGQRDALRNWIGSKWYEQLLPSSARPAERMLFIGDFEILLHLIYTDAWVPAVERTPCRDGYVSGKLLALCGQA